MILSVYVWLDDRCIGQQVGDIGGRLLYLGAYLCVTCVPTYDGTNRVTGDVIPSAAPHQITV